MFLIGVKIVTPGWSRIDVFPTSDEVVTPSWSDQGRRAPVRVLLNWIVVELAVLVSGDYANRIDAVEAGAQADTGHVLPARADHLSGLSNEGAAAIGTIKPHRAVPALGQQILITVAVEIHHGRIEAAPTLANLGRSTQAGAVDVVPESKNPARFLAD